MFAVILLFHFHIKQQKSQLILQKQNIKNILISKYFTTRLDFLITITFKILIFIKRLLNLDMKHESKICKLNNQLQYKLH